MAIFVIVILAVILLAGVAALVGGIVGLCLLRRKRSEEHTSELQSQ